MAFEYNRGPEQNDIETSVEIYDEENNLVRVVANTKAKGRAGEIALPEGNEVKNADIVPVKVTGVETEKSRGDGETVFIWDCKDKTGNIVGQGEYRIEVKQDDGSGGVKSISCIVNITDARAM